MLTVSNAIAAGNAAMGQATMWFWLPIGSMDTDFNAGYIKINWIA